MSTFFKAYDEAVISYFGATRGIYMLVGDVSVKILRHSDYGNERVIVALDHGPDDDTVYFRPVMFTARLKRGSNRATFAVTKECDRCGLLFDAPYSLAEHRIRRRENLCNDCRNYIAVKRHRFAKTEQGRRLADVVAKSKGRVTGNIDSHVVHILSNVAYHDEGNGRSRSSLERIDNYLAQIVRDITRDYVQYTVRTWSGGRLNVDLTVAVDRYGDLAATAGTESGPDYARKIDAIRHFEQLQIDSQAGNVVPF